MPSANTDGRVNKLVTLFAFAPAPGHAHLLTIKIQYTLTVFWLRSTLYRDTAPVLPTKFVTGDKFMSPINIAPRQA